MTTTRYAVGALIAVAMSVTAVLAEVKGGPPAPTFTAEETALIGRDPRLVAAAKNRPWRLREALDVWAATQRAAAAAKTPGRPPAWPRQDADDEIEGRASAEASLDLLQILKEAAGQGAKN